MLSKSSQAYKSIQEARLHLLEGFVISIDPSVGSHSSMPGWALYRLGEYVTSSTLQIDPDKPLHERLQALAHLTRKLYAEYSPDVLVYEEIPVQAYGGGRNATGHASLLKAVGVILSVSGPEHYVGLHPRSWKKLARPEYVKSDEADAVEMGWIAIEEARKMPARKNRAKPYGKD